MCFENLPIEFDAQGNARLKDGVRNPYDYQIRTPEEREAKLREIAVKNGQLADVDFDPVTRVAGALAFHSTVDLKDRKVVDTRSMATLFRGYEVILRGRDPRDAAFISSRACGVCGGVHATASALSIEMALGIKPPPMGIVVRNLLLSCEYLYDNPLHLFVLAGPDFSESLVRQTNPEIWAKAQNAPAKSQAMHGYATIGEEVPALAIRHSGDVRQNRFDQIQLSGRTAAIHGVEKNERVVALPEFLDEMNAADARLDDGHTGRQAGPRLQQLNRTYAEPVVALQDIADASDEYAHMTAFRTPEVAA